MKIVGITPGPVKFENMEQTDVEQFTPSNTGTEGQILTKGSDGYEWDDLPSVDEFEPENTGTEGQVLTKGSDGYGWEDPQGGGVNLYSVMKFFQIPETDVSNVDAIQVVYTVKYTEESSSEPGVMIERTSTNTVLVEKTDDQYGHFEGSSWIRGTINDKYADVDAYTYFYTVNNNIEHLRFHLNITSLVNDVENNITSVTLDSYKLITYGGGNEFEPENTGTLGDVLTKTATGYAWQTPSEYGPVQQSLTMNDTLRETTNLTQGTLNNESESLSDSLSITTSVEVVE